jgi:Bacteriodetes cell division protein (FtsL-like)
MEPDQNKNEEIKNSPTGKRGSKKSVYSRWLVKNIPFYLFIALLAVIYIANGHYADNTVRKINSTARNLQEMEYEYKTIKQDVIFRSKESELAKAVEPLGLKELVVPPVVLIDSTASK